MYNMGTDKVLRKSFLGGFKKESVLNYIEQLQNEILELKKQISNNNAVDDEFSALKAENDYVISESAAIAAKYDTLKAENESLSESNLQLSQELFEAKRIISEYDNKEAVFINKISEIEKKFEVISKGYMSNSASENKAVSKTSAAIENAKTEVSDINERIKTVCNNFDSSISSLKSSIENLLIILNGISEEIDICDYKG